MTTRPPRRWFRGRLDSSLRRRAFRSPLSCEPLEERVLLDAGLPPALVVGRTLSSYFVGGVQNSQETITYTVYNEQSRPLGGVLLTDALLPGVSFQAASQLPDRSGQSLAWSLGTLGGFDRASVTLTLALVNAAPGPLDAGARAFASLDGAAVSNSAPAAALRAGSVAPALLAATPDANTADPFVQEEAAKLNYDPQQIIGFLHNDVGYNSYLGSVRGARGALWSLSGNALDVASLGVALMRASGVPAQYAQGTLTRGQAQGLILSMFPARTQTVGHVPAGTQTADPADDATLLSETESHYWFQFDPGTGMTDADPLMTATAGQSTTAPTGTFSVVPDNLREKTEIRLTAEFYSEFNALLGEPLSTQTVLDQTYNDVDLVGHPLSIGNRVSAAGVGVGIRQVVYTYSPYVAVGDEASPDPRLDPVIHGTDYQEVYSNDQGGLVSQELTGLFVNVTRSGPQGPADTSQHAILDRIGYAARANPASVFLAIDPNSPPAFSNFDATVMDVLAGLQNPNVLQTDAQQLASLQDQLAPPGGGAGAALAGPLLERIGILHTRFVGAQLLAVSDALTAQLATSYDVAAYSDRPRVFIVSQHVGAGAAAPATAIDLLDDVVRSVAVPGQADSAAFNFQFARGFMESAVETTIGAEANPGATPITAAQVLTAAGAQGVSLAVLSGAADIPRLDALGLPADATARMAQALQAGQVVMVPAAPVALNGAPATAWFQTDAVSGYTTGVLSDGSHGEEADLQAEEADALLVAEVEKDLTVALTKAAASREAAQVALQTAAEDLEPQVAPGVLQLLGRAVKSVFQAGVSILVATVGFLLESFGLRGAAAGAADAAQGLLGADPPVPSELSGLAIPRPAPRDFAPLAEAAAASLTAGTIAGSIAVSNVAASGQLRANWTSSAAAAFQLTSLGTANAVVSDGAGHTVGSGPVSLSSPAAATVSGSNQYGVNGSGSLSFYGPAETNLGVGGSWAGYTATVSGNVSIALTTDGLTLNGRLLPAGTYTVTTSAATLAGAGQTTSPNFSGSAALNVTGGTIDLGAGSGNVTVGGRSLSLAAGAALDGYTGSVVVAAGASEADAVTLNGTTANVLTVSATPATLSTDQNTPVTFQANIGTSLTDTYHLLAQAPPGWGVSIDGTGKVTATPVPGVQGGTYAIRVVALSQKDANLVAQTTVNVTITPTSRGITLTVLTDPILTVPFNNAELPTAFQAQIHNTGPAPVTEDLAFSNVPGGFTLASSGTRVTIPSGQTGIVGVYLTPTGSRLPPANSTASFTVTAANAANPADVQSFDEPFTIPAMDALAIGSNPPQVESTPGTAASATITLHNTGNVDESVTLAASGSAKVGVGGLHTVTVPAGQTANETITLTPAAATALNSTLATTITATFGPTGGARSAATEIDVQVVSAQVVAVARAAMAAGQVGNDGQLAQNLSDLEGAVAQLQAAPADGAALGHVQFDLGNLSLLLSADAALTPLTSQLAAIQTNANAGDVAGTLALLPGFFGNLTDTLAVEATQQFTANLSPSQVDLTTGQSQNFTLQLANSGSDPESLTLSASGLPSGVSVGFDQTQVNLAPGATRNVVVTLTQTADTNRVFTLAVTAAASEAQHTATAVVAVRAATADVIGVTATPQVVNNPGDPLSLTARVFNTANVARSVTAQIQVLGAAGGVLDTLPAVPVDLVPGTDNLSLDLGQVATTGLANGVYRVQVALLAADGSALPGRAAQALFGVGQQVTALIAASTAFVPPGTSTVSTAITVTNQTGIGPSPPPSAPPPVEVGLDGANRFGVFNLQTGTFTPTATLRGFTSGLFGDLEHGPAGGPLYGMTSNSDLVTVDPVTATATLVGHSGNGIFGLATRPADGTLFGISFPEQRLYTIDPATGAATLVGSTRASVGGFEEIRFDDQGRLFLTDQGGGSNSLLYTLDTTTGHKTPVGSTGFPLYSTDFENGTLFGFTTDGKIVSINTTTGAGALVAGESGGSRVFTATTAAIPAGTTLIFEDGTGTPFGNFVPIPQGYGSRVTQTVQDGFAYLVNGGGTPNVVTQFSSGATVVGNLAPLIGNGTDLDVGDLHSGIVATAPHVTELDLVADPGFNVALHSFDIAGFPHLDFTIASVQVLDGDGNVLFAQQKVDIEGTQGTGEPEHTHFTFSGVQASKLRIIYDSTTDGSGNVIDSDDVAMDDINFTQESAVGVSAVVTHNLPAAGYAVDATTVNPVPTSSSATQIVWNAAGLSASNPAVFSLGGTVSNMAPGEVRQISTGTTVAVTIATDMGQQLTNTLRLPPLTVAAEHVISLAPPALTVDRNATATYTVTLTNPLPTDQTYHLGRDGLAGMTTLLAPSVTVAAGQTVSVPLQVTVPPGATPGTDVFEVVAQTDAGARDSVEGQLTVAPEVALPVRAVRVALKPAQAVAGQGNSARYVVTVTNVGSATDTYDLVAANLPASIAAAFSATTVAVPPGPGSFRTVTVTLTPAPGTAPAGYPFHVTATSTNDSSVHATAMGTLSVVSRGVSVSLSPTTAVPGSTLRLKVTNTGTAGDTFDLSLAGPAALASRLASAKVTLAAGASTTVSVGTTAAAFAVTGPLALVAVAKSEGDPAVKASATASLQVPGTRALTARVSPGVRIIPLPGTSDFLVLVNNAGSLADSYTARIQGTSGPVTAQLVGLDALLARVVPGFRLPGLFGGALVLHTNLKARATGTVTIEIDSLSDPGIKATAAVTIVAPPPAPVSRGSRRWVR